MPRAQMWYLHSGRGCARCGDDLIKVVQQPIGELANADRAAVESLISARQPHSVSFDDWRRLDELEVSAGEPNGRPRVKLTSIDEMLAALGRSGTPDRC